MPQIREYQAPEGIGLRPNETGTTAVANSARRIQGAYNEAAQAMEVLASSKRRVASTLEDQGRMLTETGRRFGNTIETVGNIANKYIENREVSQGAKTISQMQEEATKAWNETARTADPNDPTVAPKFMQDLEQRLEKFNGAFLTEGGQRFAMREIASFRDHMTRKIAADQASMAGQALAVNLEKTRNHLASTVRSDPSAIDESIRMYESAVTELVRTSPALKAATAHRVQTELVHGGKAEIVKSGLIGLAAMNPDAATKLIESGKYAEYLSGSDAKAIVANARQQVRAERIDENYRRHNEDLARRKLSDATESEYLKVIHSDDPHEQTRISSKAIVNDDRLTNTAKEKLVRIFERETKPEAPARVSQQTATDLFARMRLPEGDAQRVADTGPIDQAYIDGKLTRADHTWLRNEFREARTADGEPLTRVRNEFLKGIKPLIDKSNPMLGRIDHDGPHNVYRFERAVSEKIAEYRKANKNPHDLFDPSKPDYMGRPEALQPFQKTLQESMSDAARRVRGRPSTNLTGPDREIISIDKRDAPLNPELMRKPGETPDEYLRRRKYK